MTEELPSPSQTEHKKIQLDTSKRNHPILEGLILLVWLGVGIGISVSTGVAIAILRPNWIWQSQYVATTQSQRFTLASDALFESNKVSIRSDGYKLLDQVAAQLPLDKGKTIRIIGYVDIPVEANTSAKSALDISYRRATVVKDYLVRLRGEQTYYWIVVGYGASRPLAANDSEANRKTNRRIEIVVDAS